MSVVVLFEAEFVPGDRERYLALAQKLAERARAATVLSALSGFLRSLSPESSCRNRSGAMRRRWPLGMLMKRTDSVSGRERTAAFPVLRSRF